MVLKADTDKPHRCPECWRIPDRIWESKAGRARLLVTYTCPSGHRFARWRRPVRELLSPVTYRWFCQRQRWVLADRPRSLEDVRDLVRTQTLCRIGWHSRRSRCVRKFDGGKCPLLCRYCRLIVGTWREEA